MERYEIWQAKVKFEESDEVKERPVLIWNNHVFLIAYKMTGTNRGDDQDEYRVQYWKEAGLSKPTSIRIRKVLKLTKDDLLYNSIDEFDLKSLFKYLNKPMVDGQNDKLEYRSFPRTLLLRSIY